MEEYRTVEHEGHDSFIKKKSKFIGYVKPVTTQEEAIDFVNSVKSKHWDATHNVYAYVLRENNVQRYSDDGEPSGTAGMPVLDVIKKEGLCDVCVVATRYFGGTLLGAGGLVRAYSHTSKIAVDSGGMITMAQCSIMRSSIDYTFYERFSLLLAEYGANVISTDFAEKVTVAFSVKEDSVEELRSRIIDVSNGKYDLQFIESRFAKA